MDVKTLDQTTILQTSTDNTTGEAPSDYDHEGAMKFIISTILVYSLLGIVSMLVSRLRKKSNSYHRQLDDDVTHFIKTDKTLRESFHRQTLLYRRNTFVKMMKTADEMEKAEEEMSTDDGGEKDETADDNGPKVTFHLENEVQEKSETLNTESEVQEYDAYGAMLFVVTTVLVYAGAVIAFIAGHIKKTRFNSEEDVQIYNYLHKSRPKIQRKIRNSEVIQMRMQLLRAFQENSGCGNRRERNRDPIHSHDIEDRA